MNRRTALKTLAAATAGTAAQAALPIAPDFKIKNRRIRQSIMGWTYTSFMKADELAKLCADIGLEAVEGVDAKTYPAYRALGLKISLAGSHGFKTGPFTKANHAMVEQKLREGIDTAVANDCDKVITFTGYRESGITDAEGAQNCVDCWKRVMPYAEEKKVTLCLEHLNSRDASHPMKGHPGYFGDNVDLCVDLIKRVGSPRMKLLFDIYHVQVMHGDVIRRLRQNWDHIAHIHTAGNPGRGELDDQQEINYPPILQAILDLKYTGYVVQEFLPTWPDKAAALRHAASVCDV